MRALSKFVSFPRWRNFSLTFRFQEIENWLKLIIVKTAGRTSLAEYCFKFQPPLFFLFIICLSCWNRDDFLDRLGTEAVLQLTTHRRNCYFFFLSFNRAVCLIKKINCPQPSFFSFSVNFLSVEINLSAAAAVPWLNPPGASRGQVLTIALRREADNVDDIQILADQGLHHLLDVVSNGRRRSVNHGALIWKETNQCEEDLEVVNVWAIETKDMLYNTVSWPPRS